LTGHSLTFTFISAKSATRYRLVGDGVDETSYVNNITVDGLTGGTNYTFTVWAVGSQGLVSNNITCTGTTGSSANDVGLENGDRLGKWIWVQNSTISCHALFTQPPAHSSLKWFIATDLCCLCLCVCVMAKP